MSNTMKIRNIGSKMKEVLIPSAFGRSTDYDKILVSYETPVAAYLAHPNPAGGGVFIQLEGRASSRTTRRHIDKWLPTIGVRYLFTADQHATFLVSERSWNREPWWNPATAKQIQAVLDGKPFELRECVSGDGIVYDEIIL